MDDTIKPSGDTVSKSWRDNFVESPFEVKILTIIVALISIVTLLGLISNDTGKIIYGIAFPGSAIFLAQVAIASLKLSLREQTLGIQLQYRAWFIASSLMMLACYWMHPNLFHLYNESSQVFRAIKLYGPYYRLWLPVFLILAMAVRTIPMTIKYFKARKIEQFKVQTD